MIIVVDHRSSPFDVKPQSTLGSCPHSRINNPLELLVRMEKGSQDPEKEIEKREKNRKLL